MVVVCAQYCRNWHGNTVKIGMTDKLDEPNPREKQIVDGTGESGQPAEITESAPPELADEFSVHDCRASHDAGGSVVDERKIERNTQSPRPGSRKTLRQAQMPFGQLASCVAIVSRSLVWEYATDVKERRREPALVASVSHDQVGISVARSQGGNSPGPPSSFGARTVFFLDPETARRKRRETRQATVS